jgi:putative toxin-antitoxin system antitoxin component (TIGR02293 family)
VARIVERAFEVFASEDAARQWLKRPQAIFSGAAPLALLGGEAGVQAVEQQLGRIDYGDLY